MEDTILLSFEDGSQTQLLSAFEFTNPIFSNGELKE